MRSEEANFFAWPHCSDDWLTYEKIKAAAFYIAICANRTRRKRGDRRDKRREQNDRVAEQNAAIAGDPRNAQIQDDAENLQSKLSEK